MALLVKVKRFANRTARGWARLSRITAALACAVLCPVLAAGCSSSSSSSTTPAATTTVTVTSSAPATSAAASPPAAACATSALKLTQSAPNGAAGHFYVTLVFTNTSSTACTLYGYPGVSLLSSAQKQIGLAAKRSGKSFKLVTLAPGATGSAVLDIVDALNFSPSDCGPTKAAYLRVYPPNQFSSVLLANTSEGCAKAKQVLYIDPVQAGSSGTS